jgi:hypothetical protein
LAAQRCRLRPSGANGSCRRALLPLALAACVAGCGEDRRLEHVGAELTKALVDTLVAHRVCASRADCSRQSALLWDPGPTILDLGVYGVRQPRTVVALRAACVRYVDTTPGAPQVLLRVYRETKKETLRGARLFATPQHEINCVRRGP